MSSLSFQHFSMIIHHLSPSSSWKEINFSRSLCGGIMQHTSAFHGHTVVLHIKIEERVQSSPANRRFDLSTLPQLRPNTPTFVVPRPIDDHQRARTLAMFTSPGTSASHCGGASLINVYCFSSHFETFWMKLVKLWALQWKAKGTR
jgi:hypothetical protein